MTYDINTFKQISISSGYASKKEVEEFCNRETKKEYTDDDFIDLYHSSWGSHFPGARVHARGIAAPFNYRLGKTTAGCGRQHAG